MGSFYFIFSFVFPLHKDDSKSHDVVNARERERERERETHTHTHTHTHTLMSLIAFTKIDFRCKNKVILAK